jgi:hypothetical protein
VAKTKGKFRVVTMQSARVKQVLEPVNTHLYDFISRKSWLVRGELSGDHLEPVLKDLRKGEVYISGDFASATDNISLSLGKALGDLLCESPHLTEEERWAIRGTLACEDRFWVSKSGRRHEIRRGLMMGSKLSFSLLCLINRACWEITCDLRRCATGDYSPRAAVFNGDDCAFCGDPRFFAAWRDVVGTFGMVVNEEKTGLSSEWLELNSKSFDVVKGAFVPKPVLSALRNDSRPGCVLTALVTGFAGLKRSTLMWAIAELRFQITRKGVDPGSVPAGLIRRLFRKRWFRIAAVHKPELVEQGIKRAWPVTSSNVRPASGWETIYDRASRDLLSFGVSLLRGVPLRAYEVSAPASGRAAPLGPRLSLTPRKWVWRWPTPLLGYWTRLGYPVEVMRGAWQDSHPCLASTRVIKARYVGKPPLAYLSDCVRPNGVNLV